MDVVLRLRNRDEPFLLPRADRLALPRDATRVHTLGRHPHADLLLGHPTVWCWHATVRFEPALGWVLTDLGSTNGTRLNGWRLVAPHVVRAGDRVAFGLVSVVISR